jgi:hypothetical protein
MMGSPPKEGTWVMYRKHRIDGDFRYVGIVRDVCGESALVDRKSRDLTRITGQDAIQWRAAEPLFLSIGGNGVDFTLDLMVIGTGETIFHGSTIEQKIDDRWTV